jgi:hypothetical protein
MKSGKARKLKGAKRKHKQVYSTSEARSRMAEVLDTAQADAAIIGFERYGRTRAVLVPPEAIYMLAGLGQLVPSSARRKIEKGARLFISNAPDRLRARRKSGRAASRKAAAVTRTRAKRA